MSAESTSIVAASRQPGPSFDVSRLVRAAGFVAVVLALTAAGVTFFLLMGLTPIAPTQDVVIAAMVVNGALVAFLVFVVGWELGGLLLARRRGRGPAAYPCRGAVQRGGRDAGDPGGDRRQHHPRPRARQLVLDAYPLDH